MRIICPTCESHYEVEADKIGANGQMVRCAQCREVWFARLPEGQAPTVSIVAAVAHPVPAPQVQAPSRAAGHNAFAAAAVAVASESAPIDFIAARARLRRAAQPGASGARHNGSAGMLSALAVFVTVAGLAIGFRAAVVSGMPASAPAFAALGLPVNTEGLALRDVHSAVVAENGKPVLSLEGRIANLRNEPTPVPPLKVVVRDGQQGSLYSYTAEAPKPTLAKGETVAFRSRLATPPQGGRDVRVSFAEAGAPTR